MMINQLTNPLNQVPFEGTYKWLLHGCFKRILDYIVDRISLAGE